MRYEVMVIESARDVAKGACQSALPRFDPDAQKKINQCSKEGWSLKAVTLHHPQRVWSLFFERALSEA